jgi:hypothetical protein
VADHAWTLLRLAELFRALERHQDRALRILYRLDPRMRPSFAVTLKAAQVEHVHREAAELAQIFEQIEALIGTLPNEESLAISYDDVRASAEHVLRHGETLDATTILLAAQLLDRSTGLPALAEGLRSSGTYASWGTMTVGSLVGAFRGVSPQLARRIATATRMAPGTEVSGCHPEEIAQLAEQLDMHARR